MTEDDNMRQDAEWMRPSDDRILELLREHKHLTPAAVEKYGGPTSGHVRNRMSELVRYGLAERVTYGLYTITDEGKAYLNEELDASELEPVDE